MKTLFILFFFLFTLQAFAQEENSNFDFRFGLGRSILGTGDMRTTVFENELNYKINQYFSTSLGVGYGRSNKGVFISASFLQGNANVYLSPFKNSGKNDFRIGTGLSYINVSDARLTSAWFNSKGEMVDAEYEFDVRDSYGYNIILENTYTIKSKFLLGLKLFTQPYFSGDLNSGILLKLGIKL